MPKTLTLAQGALEWLRQIWIFSWIVIRRTLYRYQLEPAQAIVDSVIFKRGLEFAVLFPRQSGKNETQSHVEAYLLNMFRRTPGAQIVKAQPTFKPQAINAMLRLERALDNDWNRNEWSSKAGYIYQLGQAVMTFFSAEPSAQAVGASATLMLEGDEAQDILESEWGKKFEPMMASTNATMVLWGTAWTSKTLLARAVKRLRALELADGIRRVFVVTPERVAEENPAYGAFVARQVAKHGRNHPLVRTQYFNETIDADGGMFPAARRALMVGTHPRAAAPSPGKLYAFLLDVAGEDEGATGDRVVADREALANPERDAVALTVVEVDPATVHDPSIAAPSYKAVDRRLWIGVKHTMLYGQIVALARLWNARHVVVDATGVGAGLASFLDRALTGKVIPFIFNSATKSKLGWDFLAIVETGRWHDWAVPDSPLPAGDASPGAKRSGEGPGVRASSDPESLTFWHELTFVQYEAGLHQTLKWGTPPNTRDPATGELVHDDTVISAALSAVLDELDWSLTVPMAVIPGRDPLEDIDRGR